MNARNHRPTVTHRVREVVPENEHVRTLVLEQVGGSGSGASYLAGQFLTLHLPLAPGRVVSRSYSVSSCPATDAHMMVTVKREPDGEGSNWLYLNATPGTCLEASPATGNFVLDDTDRPLQLFAAGVGVTPIFSLCKYALNTTRRTIWLHYTCQSPAHAIFAAQLEQLRRQNTDRLHITIHYSDTAGRLEPGDVKDHLRDAADSIRYICGPGPYIEMIRDTAVAAGTSPTDIVVEAFTPVSTTAPLSAEPPTIAKVQFDGDEHTVPWPRNQSLVDAMEATGLTPPTSCRQGECLTCECAVLDGATDMKHNGALDQDDIADGYALACQLLPRSDLVTIRFD